MKKEFKVQELIDVLNGMDDAGIHRVPSLEAKTTMTKEKIDIYRPKPEDYKRVLGATLAWDRPVEWVDFPEGTDAMVTGRRLAAKIEVAWMEKQPHGEASHSGYQGRAGGDSQRWYVYPPNPGRVVRVGRDTNVRCYGDRRPPSWDKQHDSVRPIV